MPDPRWLTTEQAAQLLGVKASTVYAYVSRGQLTRHHGPDRRSSRFERAEVERLAARARRGGRAGALDVVLDTELTLLDPAGRLYFRGRDATVLASQPFEQVAELLWAGPAERPDPPVWAAEPRMLAVARAVQAALPPGTRPADRFRVAVAALPATDPFRYDQRPAAVAATGRGLIAAAVDCLPPRSAPVDDSVAARLWAGCADRPPTPAQLRAFDAALVLSADHELAVSALAARVAASARADPYLAVLAGLAALGGGLHGGSVGAAEALLTELAAGRTVADLVADRLAAGDQVPGFGHAVYTGTDPRAEAVLRLLGRGPDAALGGRFDELVAAVGRHGGPRPNFDLALGALAVTWNLAPGSAEAVFVLGRCAGLLGHTIEEYRHRFRFRPRAVYVGAAPATDG
ncbi:citrate synthase [Actinocatenispora thailandica]|uniref:citrate synthase (unknown stereospecificity) n=1 Tax=Actinocatenispora thailandica TaxID=227318 RepID=A0A7R7HVM4_9ACTN|nr:citrate synthase [Actinocatenispora thailandica]BCJ33049.1 citrate synthase [Actinocatenispora thailandica]